LGILIISRKIQFIFAPNSSALKQVLLLLFLFLPPVLLTAQQQDSSIHLRDSLISTDTLPQRDTLVLPLTDSLTLLADSLKLAAIQAIAAKVSAYHTTLKNILSNNSYLNTTGRPVAMPHRLKAVNQEDYFFYILAVTGLLVGFLRFFYTRYFNNLFRVFFNASLRQSQLTDQLLQAKLPSLFFNIIFVITGGIYVYLVLRYYQWISTIEFWKVLLYCTLSLAAIYLVKFMSLKFTGWVTGYKEVTNTYIFVIFLINKILGILLLPFAVVMAFSMPSLATTAIIISLLLIGLMFLLRFFRSYGLLQNKLKVSRFHFMMYVIGIEIIPVLLIYKGLVILLSKNQ